MMLFLIIIIVLLFLGAGAAFGLLALAFVEQVEQAQQRREEN